MTFKNYIDSPCGFRYIYDNLEILSSPGRRELLNSKYITSETILNESYNNLIEFYNFFKDENSYKDLISLQNILSQVNDIKGSLDNLSNNCILDDIELYEIKMLAFYAINLKTIISSNSLNYIEIPNVKDVFELLDPDNLNVPSFYIYDSYSPDLKYLRGEIEKLNIKNSSLGLTDEESKRLALLIGDSLEIESSIRFNLSNKLSTWSEKLYKSLKEIAKLDILLAKAKLIDRFSLTIPAISSDTTTIYEGLFYPQIKDILQSSNREFTPININFGLYPLSIIGANMGGKTVVLKMLALSQLMFQFGLGVPALKAVIDIKDGVVFSIGDNQNELQGLSSFAAEIRDIDNIINQTNKGKKLLALIDEPARTTNPVEGNALVCSLIKLFTKKSISLVMTTHYRIPDNLCKRLKVRGFINKCMNYNLYEPIDGEIPHEAIDIARELGASEEWLTLTNEELYMNKLN